MTASPDAEQIQPPRNPAPTRARGPNPLGPFTFTAVTILRTLHVGQGRPGKAVGAFGVLK